MGGLGYPEIQGFLLDAEVESLACRWASKDRVFSIFTESVIGATVLMFLWFLGVNLFPLDRQGGSVPNSCGLVSNQEKA
jgi:hypothetical protein